MIKAPGARCDECPLNENIFVPSYIPKNPIFIAVGEAPGGMEVIEGEPFVGDSGKLLQAAVEMAGGDPKNIMKTNVVACRPYRNRAPTRKEVACCLPRLKREIALKPGVPIAALGVTAQDAIGIDGKNKGVLFQIPDHIVMPAWHPAYTLRKPSYGSEFLVQIRRMVQGPLIPNMFSYPERIWPHTVEGLEVMLENCPTDSWVALDFETNQVRWYPLIDKPANAIIMLQILWNPKYAVIVDDAMLYDTPGVPEILQRFFDRVRTVGHNVKFDAVFSKAHLDVSIRQDFDTMLASYALDENLAMGLKAITSREYGMPDYEVDTILPYLKTRNDEYSKVPAEVLAKYGAMDVLITWHLRKLYEDRLREEGLYEWPFKNILMYASNELTEVEIRGMGVDVEQLRWVADEFERVMIPLEQGAQRLAENPTLNIRSPVQVAEVLFDKFKLPTGTIRKLNPRSTNAQVLAGFKGKNEFVDALLEYRRVHKLRSSYAVNLLGQVSADHSVHGSFQIPGTEVGRLSIRNPALQTMPRPGDYYGSLIRSSFVARPGKVLLRLDYPQAELRAFACYSQEPFLLLVFRDGRDLHTEVTIAMYGENWTKEQRVLCKMFNFSYLYGGSEYSFAEGSGLNISIARQFVRQYNSLMPVGLKYKKETFKLLKEQGYVQTIFGRRRRFPLITRANVDEARKACVHMLCASTASDINLLAGLKLNELARRGPPGSGVPVVLLIHDEVIAEVDDNPEAIAAGRIAMAKVMRETAEEWLPDVPWPLTPEDVEVKYRWAEPLPQPL